MGSLSQDNGVSILPATLSIVPTEAAGVECAVESAAATADSEAEEQGETSPQSPPFSAWVEQSQMLTARTTVTEDFLEFEDKSANADAALFGSRPITTGLQLTRWRATISIIGLVCLATAFFSIWEYRRAGPPNWQSCSHFMANFTQSAWSWFVWLIAAQVNFYIPVLLNTRRIGIDTTCLVMGALYGLVALRPTVLTIHVLFLVVGFDDNIGACSQELLLATGFRYATYMWSFHTSYTFLVDQSRFYVTLWGWSLLQLTSSCLHLILGVGGAQDEIFSWSASVPLLFWLIITQTRRTLRLRQARRDSMVSS
eukprot:TRINITY_DN19888_c0_g1_i1.p1 TRINITY_DN19888_c0_g1~~TRINITY_DN19888_c0_g1_i1.p1  ORF type:complete len:312 (+),score=15.53 TRINITY_DN19888_c0_g1_i1:213-1148(+)